MGRHSGQSRQPSRRKQSLAAKSCADWLGLWFASSKHQSSKFKSPPKVNCQISAGGLRPLENWLKGWVRLPPAPFPAEGGFHQPDTLDDATLKGCAPCCCGNIPSWQRRNAQRNRPSPRCGARRRMNWTMKPSRRSLPPRFARTNRNRREAEIVGGGNRLGASQISPAPGAGKCE